MGWVRGKRSAGVNQKVQQGITILIIAPAMADRTSLRFMLEAEGYDTFALKDLAALSKSQSEFDCVVVDEKALGRSPEALEPLQHLGRPIVVLVDPGKRIVYPPHIFRVEKPMLGSAVLQAVGAMLTLTPAVRPSPST
jgi:hypothetical protein